MQDSAKQMDKPTSTLQDWTTAVAKEFENKEILHEYTNVPIPALMSMEQRLKKKGDFKDLWSQAKKDYPADKKLRTKS